MKKVEMIVDLQYGSTGKGLIAGYLADKYEYDVVMNANMPNAGHTFIDDRGQKMIHKVLPNGVVSPKCKYALLGAGSVFDPVQLNRELLLLADFGYDHFEVLVHPQAVVLKHEHKVAEAEQLNSIASTMQGSAEAVIEKMRRPIDSNPVAQYNEDVIQKAIKAPYLVRVTTIDEYNRIVDNATKILLEGAQGFSLSINERFYPYATSRDCTPARFMSDCGLPLPYLSRVIGTARMHPIRVGNTEGGYSGDHYDDQEELSWDDLGVDAETTTVTGRIRRVYSFSQKQIADAIRICQPEEVFLNFCNYAPDQVEKTVSAIDSELVRYGHGGQVKYTGFGPTVADIRDRFPRNPCDYTQTEFQLGYID